MTSASTAPDSGCSSPALLVVVTVLGGAYPAFVLARVPPIEALRIGRSKSGPRFATTLLVGGQFAAASFLLIVVIVMYAQNRELAAHRARQRRRPAARHRTSPNSPASTPSCCTSELARIPQVRASAETSHRRGRRASGWRRSAARPKTVVHAAYQNTVGYDYFTTLGYTLLAAAACFDREHGEDFRPHPRPPRANR